MTRHAFTGVVLVLLMSLSAGTAQAQPTSEDHRALLQWGALRDLVMIADIDAELGRIRAALHDYDHLGYLQRELAVLESQVTPLEQAHGELAMRAAELENARELAGDFQSFGSWRRQPPGVVEAETRYQQALVRYEQLVRATDTGGDDLTELQRKRDALRTRVARASSLQSADLRALQQRLAALEERSIEIARTNALFSAPLDTLEARWLDRRNQLDNLEFGLDPERLAVPGFLQHSIRLRTDQSSLAAGDDLGLRFFSREEVTQSLVQAVREQRISMEEGLVAAQVIAAFTGQLRADARERTAELRQELADIGHRLALEGRSLPQRPEVAVTESTINPAGESEERGARTEQEVMPPLWELDASPRTDTPSVSDVVGGGMPQVIAITETVTQGWSDVVTVVGSPERHAPPVDREPAPLSLPAESAVTPLPRSSGTVYGRIDCQRDDGKAWGDRRSWQDYVETGGAQVDWAQGRINLVLRHGLAPGPAFPIARIRADLSPDGSFSATTNRAEIQGQILLDPNTGKLASGSGRHVYRFSPMAATVVYTCVDNFRIEGGR